MSDLLNSSYIGLIDCNNFFASCECIFEPSLKGRPLGILSNNDGCFIARSNELKCLGVGMGAPYFQVRDIIDRNGVVVKSANFALYSDISRRIMSVLKREFPCVEVYSIDEAFIHFGTNVPSVILKEGKAIREKIYKWIGVPVSIGIAKTKTLAKVACKVAKNGGQGVCLLETEEEIEGVLGGFDIGDIWGIGRERAKFLKTRGIAKALDFVRLPEEWVHKHMSICGLRTLLELKGVACFGLEEGVENNKTILRSGTFGRPTSEKEDVMEAVAYHASRVAEVLRSQNGLAESMGVFIRTSRFGAGEKYSESSIEYFLEPTDYTPELLRAGRVMVDRIFKAGYRYVKAGVYCPRVIPSVGVQRDLFKAHEDVLRREEAMRVLDEIRGRYGKKGLFYGSLGTKNAYERKKNRVSPCYTTSWNELAVVR